MNVLILPGGSKRHKEWGEELSGAISTVDGVEEVLLHHYRHWNETGGDPHVSQEAFSAGRLANDLGDLLIVAKSLGTVVAAEGIASAAIVADRALFMGVPLTEIDSDNDFGINLEQISRVSFLQNVGDPYGGFDQLVDFIADHAPWDYDLMVGAGSTHDYTDFAQISQLVGELLTDR